MPTLITITRETVAVRAAAATPPTTSIQEMAFRLTLSKSLPAAAPPPAGRLIVEWDVVSYMLRRRENGLHNTTGTRRVASAPLPIPPFISLKTLSLTQRSIQAPFGFEFQILENMVEQKW